jgi:hypothetical protein
MARPVREHRHHQGQVVVATADNAKQIRDHQHRSAQIYGTPTNNKERAMGKRHLHTASQVS